MTSELSSDQLSEKIAQRGEDGELVPEEHEIDWFGETVTVKTKPITTGLLNELANIDEAVQTLEPKAVHEALQKIYVTDAIRNLTAQEIDDMKADALTSILEPLNEAVESDIGADNPNPVEMDRSERARKMRSNTNGSVN